MKYPNQSRFKNRIIILESRLIEDWISQLIPRAIFYRYVGDISGS
jgi:hypothetical protein